MDFSDQFLAYADRIALFCACASIRRTHKYTLEQALELRMVDELGDDDDKDDDNEDDNNEADGDEDDDSFESYYSFTVHR